MLQIYFIPGMMLAEVMVIDALSRRRLVRKPVVDQSRSLGIIGARKHQADQQQTGATPTDERRQYPPDRNHETAPIHRTSP